MVTSSRGLATHDNLGAFWEGFALEVAARAIGKRPEDLAFWATHTGAEVDLFWQEHGKNWDVEFKYADAPRLSRSMVIATEVLELEHLRIVYPDDRAYPVAAKVSILPWTQIGDGWSYA